MKYARTGTALILLFSFRSQRSRNRAQAADRARRLQPVLPQQRRRLVRLPQHRRLVRLPQRDP